RRTDGQAPFERRAFQPLDFALSLLSGALLALSFPKFGHPVLAWVALTPWIAALMLQSERRRAGRGRSFLLGLALGAAYFAGTLYWIPEVLVTFGGVN